jgi:hypothetical protein
MVDAVGSAVGEHLKNDTLRAGMGSVDPATSITITSA